MNNKVIGIHKEGVINNFNKGSFLNYPIKDFISLHFNINNNEMIENNNEANEMLLKELNERYKLNIENTDIKILNLRWKEMGNEGLKDLCKIEFRELKEINLHKNNISNIEALIKAKFDKLEILNLGQNDIEDIKALEKVNFKELKELYLYSNNISDITVFEKNIFDKLEILYL